jgi:membrane-associated protease RseP (regulator of RpoE activity)
LKKIWFNILYSSLFILTFFTTTLAGVQWLYKDPLELANFWYGLPYSISILAMLSAHEFGHYFAARYHKISATLPFYIPAPPFLVNPFGTLGAVIRIRSGWTSKKSLFDIGITGPIAGFIVSIALLIYGFLTLPDISYIYTIHPEYIAAGKIPENGFTFGQSILFYAFTKIFASGGMVPPMNEIYHYPFLCVGWFGLFVTALNMMPVGQLDGGHIMYALVGGKTQALLGKIFFALLLGFGLLSIIPIIGSQIYMASVGWILWSLILFFVIKLKHPEIYDPTPLSSNRKLLGWIMIIIFVLTFPPVPFIDFG